MRLVLSSGWMGTEWKKCEDGNRVETRMREETAFSEFTSVFSLTLRTVESHTTPPQKNYIIKVNQDVKGTQAVVKQ